MGTALPAAGRAPVYRDRSFYGMLATQFLGAFNDNVYKQIVLFACVAKAVENPYQNIQGVATTVFSLPFILFSGYFGYLSDITSKRSVVVQSKVLEIAVMLAGLWAILSGQLTAMLVVLFFMGAQSTYFGPAKYGILPELFRARDLPRANGVILMTTFLAIIFAFATAGFLATAVGERLWMASLACVAIAVLGTLTSLLVRGTPVAHPQMPFEPSQVLVGRDTRRLLKDRPKLLTALAATSLFWTAAGVVYPPVINDTGLLQFGLSEAATGLLAASTGVGITLGCLTAGWLSHSYFNARLVRLGAVGMLAVMILLALPGREAAPRVANAVDSSAGEPGAAASPTVPLEDGLSRDGLSTPASSRVRLPLLSVPAMAIALVMLGVFAGLFSVPLQVYLQAKAPPAQKGRIIATMNLANFTGLACSGVAYQAANWAVLKLGLPHNAKFAAAALILLPLALLYRPQSEALGDDG